MNGDLHLDLWGGTCQFSESPGADARGDSSSGLEESEYLIVGQDKPIVSPRDPSSLAQVAFSPLTSAGNLWLWQPQVRFEQRFALGDNMGVRAQAGVYETSEPTASAGPQYAATLSPDRPALQGRFEFWRNFGSERASRSLRDFTPAKRTWRASPFLRGLFTVDWMIQPHGQTAVDRNVFQRTRTRPGIGGLRQGFTIFGEGMVRRRGDGGRLGAVFLLRHHRLTFNSTAARRAIGRRICWPARSRVILPTPAMLVYHLGPNVLLGWKPRQVRTAYLGFHHAPGESL